MDDLSTFLPKASQRYVVVADASAVPDKRSVRVNRFAHPHRKEMVGSTRNSNDSLLYCKLKAACPEGHISSLTLICPIAWEFGGVVAALLVVRARKGWRCAVALMHAKEAALHGQCTRCSEGLRKLCAGKSDREIGLRRELTPSTRKAHTKNHDSDNKVHGDADVNKSDDGAK
eukprot:gene17432-biopygen8511